MDTTSKGVYEDNLRHYARPSNDREAKAEGEALNDYEALYLAEILHEWAEYLASDEKLADIARGYVEFIRRRQQETGGYRQLKLYAHTPEAGHVLMEGFDEWKDAQEGPEGVAPPSYHPSLLRQIEDAVTGLWAEFYDEDDGYPIGDEGGAENGA